MYKSMIARLIEEPLALSILFSVFIHSFGKDVQLYVITFITNCTLLCINCRFTLVTKVFRLSGTDPTR